MARTTHTPLMLSTLLLVNALACGADPSGEPTSGPSSDTGVAGTDSTGASEPATTGDLPTTAAATEATASTSGATTDPTTDVADDTGTTSADTTTTATTGAVEPGTTGSTGTTSDDTTGGASGTSGPGETGDATAGSTGTGGPEGLGVLSGDCGLIDAMELESPEPFVFDNAIDLGVDGFDESLLTPGGMQMIAEGGLNDGSLKSEIIAYEVLARCDMATLLKTEAKIVYQNPMGKKTDILVEMGDYKVGVSVVRAVGFPKDDPYTVAQATTILKKKLGDIQVSSANVAAEDAWVKQILHVVAYGPMHVESVLAAYAALDAPLKADTILVVSVTDGDDSALY